MKKTSKSKVTPKSKPSQKSKPSPKTNPSKGSKVTSRTSNTNSKGDLVSNSSSYKAKSGDMSL